MTLLALAITVTSVPLHNAIGTNEVVQAANVKLSKSSLTLDVGKSATLKVTGTKSKVKWSSSNKRIATVTSKGKVTAKQAGSTTITAKVGNKALKCKVTAKEQFSASEATKKISVTLQDTGSGVVAILKNNNKVAVSVEAKMAYYSNGKMIDTASDSNYVFESGEECALFFYAPYDSDYNNISYDDYKITLSIEKANYASYDASGIDIDSNIGADNVSAEVKNNSGKNLEFIKIAIVFYDSNGNAVGYDTKYAECQVNGSVDYMSFDFPYDDDYEIIFPSSYKIYVNTAHDWN